MAHETNHDAEKEKKNSIISFKSSFWLVVIILFLFIAALNFIKVMSGSKEEEKTTGIAKPDDKNEGTMMKAEGEKNTASDTTHH